jgi:S-adenosylmethionine-diacylgycerolhomoserine-N-methlytransferase
MIPDWRQALSAAGQALAEDGRLHAVDFGDLTGLGPVAGGLLRGWLHLFHVEPRVEILAALERQTNHISDNSGHIILLPARYAFLWTSSKRGIEALA